MDTEHGRAIRERLVTARRKAKLTQKEAGDRLSLPVTAQTISNWERGHGFPSPREWTELATIYGVSLDWLGTGIASTPETGSTLVDRLLGRKAAEPSPPPVSKADRKDFQRSG